MCCVSHLSLLWKATSNIIRSTAGERAGDHTVYGRLARHGWYQKLYQAGHTWATPGFRPALARTSLRVLTHPHSATSAHSHGPLGQ